MRKVFFSFVHVAAALAVLLFVSPAYAQNTAQAFALMDAGDDAAAFRKFLAMPDVDGIAVRSAWKFLEPAEGKFDWSRIDAAFDAAKAAHKKVTLHVIASAYTTPPPWVFADGAKSYQENNPFRPDAGSRDSVVPWDAVFLSKWSAFLQAMAQHVHSIVGDAVLEYVSVTVPLPEMSIAGCRAGRMGASGEIAYARDVYLNAWRSSMAATQAAFPHVLKLVSAPVQQICMPDNDGARFYGDVFSIAQSLQPGGFMIFAADLNARGSQRLDNVANLLARAPVGLQFIWSYTEDPRGHFGGTLDAAICRGLRSYGSRYFEVYKQDLLNPDSRVQSSIALIHNSAPCR
jgi:hypothetical protein